jgi:hypothetical protein
MIPKTQPYLLNKLLRSMPRIKRKWPRWQLKKPNSKNLRPMTRWLKQRARPRLLNSSSRRLTKKLKMQS